MARDLNYNPRLMKQLIPTHPVGCKRVTPSDCYNKSFLKDNVKLVQEQVVGFAEDGIITKAKRDNDYEKYPVDVCVMCTGFSVDSVIRPCVKIGRDGKTLSEEWTPTPKAFFGLTYPDFPNLFFMMGPNSGCASNSFIYLFEAQADYIISCLRMLSKKTKVDNVFCMSLKPESLERFQQLILQRLKGKAFDAEYCSSWFFSGGVNWALWPGTCRSYRKLLGKCDESDYDFS